MDPYNPQYNILWYFFNARSNWWLQVTNPRLVVDTASELIHKITSQPHSPMFFHSTQVVRFKSSAFKAVCSRSWEGTGRSVTEALWPYDLFCKDDNALMILSFDSLHFFLVPGWFQWGSACQHLIWWSIWWWRFWSNSKRLKLIGI